MLKKSHITYTQSNIMCFTYLQVSGEIKAKVSLDREAKDLYTVQVTGTDNGTPKRSKLIKLKRFLKIFLTGNWIDLE